MHYILTEDKNADNSDFMDWFEFVKNSKKARIEKELNFIKNINMVGNNSKLLIFFKNCLENYKNYANLINNFKKKNNHINMFRDKNNINRVFNLFNYYINFSYNKLLKIKSKNIYKNSENLILIFDIRPLKPKIFVMSNNRCFFSITSGLIYKKLNLKQKKIKKTEKMFNLMMKTIATRINKQISYKKCIIHVKGTRSNIFNVLVLINKNFNKKKISLIFSPHVNHGFFSFKKVKSIKKRLRKKFSRLIKN